MKPSKTLKDCAIVVCGGRNYTQTRIVYAALDLIHRTRGIWLLISGGAPGADTISERWADERKVPKLILHAHWKEQGNPAGPIRNRKMAQVGPDAAIAFPGGRGTADMISILKEMDIPVWYPTGSFTAG